jgi:hypothetical protein
MDKHGLIIQQTCAKVAKVNTMVFLLDPKVVLSMCLVAWIWKKEWTLLRSLM